MLMTFCFSAATSAWCSRSTVRAKVPILSGVVMVCAGPLCDGNSNLMTPTIAAAAAADPALGRGQLGVRALELGFPVAEQAGVFLVRVVPPEVLVRVGVVV